MSWKHAFLKNIWIPMLALLIVVVAFIYDTISTGWNTDILLAYVKIFLLISILLYIPIVLVHKSPFKATRNILIVLFLVFIIAGMKRALFSDALRKIINDSLDLDYFIGALTIFALVITIAMIEKEFQSKPKGNSSVLNFQPVPAIKHFSNTKMLCTHCGHDSFKAVEMKLSRLFGQQFKCDKCNGIFKKANLVRVKEKSKEFKVKESGSKRKKHR